MPAKLRIGMFSFTSCEGCFCKVLELLDQEHEKILALLEIKSARLIQKKSEIKDLDVAFVEGSIATSKDLEKLKEIRENSKKIILLGTCATDGWPSTQRNNFSNARKSEIALSVRKAGQLNEVLKPESIVKVDAKLFGCPINNEQFKELLKQQFKEFGVKYA
ncbi:MAG: hypothetical protein Q7R70_02180 [Candidatus Diapherotrites archaeon]|nr:hypothetical protein [Candidatus Diapherotrites archaeon]